MIQTIQKKICMVGTFGVGKTSLVERFVEGIYSEKYQTTLGMKLSRKAVTVEGPDGNREVNLMLWDLAGENPVTQVSPAQLRAAHGYLLVADGTRSPTLDALVELQQRVEATVGPVPFTCVVNKHDLLDAWEVNDAALAQVAERGWQYRLTSAKSGEAVEELFLDLTRRMLAGSASRG